MQGARFVRAVAATLAAIAFVAGLLNLVRFTDLEHFGASVSNSLRDHKYEAPVPPLRFVVTATSLNPAERRVQTTLRLVPEAWDGRPMFVDPSGMPVERALRLKPAFSDAKLEITLRNSFFGETAVSYPLAHVLDPFGPEDSHRVSASIPADVDPTQFPNDSYSLDLTVSVRLPEGVAAAAPQDSDDDRAAVGIAAGGYLPTAIGLAIDDRLKQWNLDTNTVVAGGQETNATTRQPVHVARIEAEFTRRWTYWAFIYSVSLMPAVIGLSFFVRTRRRRGSNDTSAAMELAAALLALIALRQVFVPTDIVGLTRLDFLLGVQLLAVCWLIAVTYVAEPPTPEPPPPSPAEPPTTRPKPAKPRPRKPVRLAARIPDGAVSRIT